MSPETNNPPEPPPICSKCKRPYHRYNYCWMPHDLCHCFEFTVPIRDDGTAVLPDGRVVIAPKP